MKDMRREDED
ncbi:Protein of unknown function [Bacillus wiedmannii]|uniref:Uncharacterized protein n=2 Tax=Bacillus cereus group TaxID=86661 RepID=A0A1C4GAH5_BACTU|nr:Protein of unknown function [Bacillus wiedmannii]SCC65200.1 Protein of unknown function [Bacillus thuringiensis]SCM09976.1 Protein of unknown function [Bacillus wiedmannii]SCN11128.1 Protein of unknown function [Bacillus wiedmannii]